MKVTDPSKVKDYPSLSGGPGAEFHLLAGQPAEVGKHFEKAMKLARAGPRRFFFERKLKDCRLGAAQIDDR
jgi:hypothetical protein